VKDDYLTIGNKSYPFYEEMIDNEKLNFYPENPRIYSLLVIEDETPEQSEIEYHLTNMEHVKTLRLSIEANGGLIDSIIVRDGDYVVLEGNSRLAAYRMLAKRDPIKWGKVKCRVLPSDISDEAIFILLGQYHIVGRQDWSPFEQAGYLWRRVHKNDINPTMLAKEMGLSPSKTNKMVAVYDFMKTHDNVDPQKWSYYEEYLKSRYIKQARLDMPELDQTIVTKIKTGHISQAIDIRKKLEPVTRIQSAKRRKKALSSFISGDITLDECFEIAENNGVNTSALQSLLSAKKKLNSFELGQLAALSQEDKEKCLFQVKKLYSRIKEIEKKLASESMNKKR